MNENIESIITKEEDTDTLNYWFRSFDYDTLRFEVKHKMNFDEFKLKNVIRIIAIKNETNLKI